MSYWSRITNAFRSDRVNREIDEELASHLDEAIDQGRRPDEARRSLGSVLHLREESRDARLITWLDGLRSDFVFGCRQLTKNRATSLAAILSLGLAMGASMAAFRLLDAMLLRPLPVSDPGRLFVLAYPYLDSERQQQLGDSYDYPQFQLLRSTVRDQAELIAISSPERKGLTLPPNVESERFMQQFVSGRTFDFFGLKPSLGRLFSSRDDVTPGAHPVAVISYDYWQRRFGGDRAVIGRTYRSGNSLYEIVGVCAEGFTGTEPGTVTDVFVPAMMNSDAISKPDWSWFRIWVHPRAGVEPEAVRQKLRAAASAYRHERVKTWNFGATKEDIDQYLNADLLLTPASSGVSELQKDYRLSLAVLAVVVLLVLLIACANVANLMTAQAAARRREMALRVSIGAGRARLVQLVMTESILVALAATLLGSCFAWWAAPFVVSRINPPDNPARLILSADWRMIAFAAALAAAVTLSFGLIPALRASAVRPMSALKGGEDPHSRRRLMNLLVAAQVAFCFVVCFVAGLFVTTLNRLSHQPTGFLAAQVLTIEIVTHDGRPSTHWDELRRHIQSVDGVESAAISGWALMTNIGWSSGVWAGGNHNNSGQEPYFLAASPSWFETMRIPMIDGRDFRPEDKFPGAVVVNDSFARSYFGGRNPIGQTVETMAKGKRVPSTIVGCVRDARYRDMRESIRPTLYVPLEASVAGTHWTTLAVRTKAENPLSMASLLRQEVRRSNPDFRVVNIRTQTELVEQHTVRERLLALLSVFFAVVALALAGIGLYGVLSYSVLERRREIGIRMALGASMRAVAGRVAAEIASMLAIGSIAGLAAGLLSQRYLETLLYQVKATDAGILAAPVVTVLAIAVLASLPPILDAVGIDPATTLRAE